MKKFLWEMKLCEFTGLAGAGAFDVTLHFTHSVCACPACFSVEQNDQKTRFFHLQISQDTLKSAYNIL